LALPRVDEIMFTEEQIHDKVCELAARINSDYAGRPLLLVGILKGAFMFIADLARHVDLPIEFDFIALTSYGSAKKTSGVVRIRKDLDIDVRGRDLLVVEDIIDTGLTLRYLTRDLNARGPASLEICALLDKQIEEKVELRVKYVGFTIPDVFVVGYGLDCAESYRNLPYIATVVDDVQP
jgi:hypoxanthine phosphoribosyltransferase